MIIQSSIVSDVLTLSKVVTAIPLTCARELGAGVRMRLTLFHALSLRDVKVEILLGLLSADLDT